jgi:hypothetical protein
MQKLAGPALDFVVRVGITALDAVGEVRHLAGDVGDGKSPGGLRGIELGGSHATKIGEVFLYGGGACTAEDSPG